MTQAVRNLILVASDLLPQTTGKCDRCGSYNGPSFAKHLAGCPYRELDAAIREVERESALPPPSSHPD